MKRFWIFLLSVGLIMAFGTTVFAADAKFNGEFYLQGWYNKNASLIDQDSTVGPSYRGSTAFYTQRLRMGMEFNVARGLKLVTRFDALERKWMAARRAAPAGGASPGYASTDSEAENIAFEVAYLQFALPVGMFAIGNIPASNNNFGSPYGENHGFSSGVMSYTYAKGAWYISAGYKRSTDGYVKTTSGTWPMGTPGTPIGAGTDNDSTTYSISTGYRWKGGAAGLHIGDVRSRTANVPHPGGSTNTVSRKTEIPYGSIWFQQKFGRFFIEDEFGICPFGDYVKWNEPFTPIYPYYKNIEADMAISNYFGINIDLSPVKLGFFFIYSRGDDPETMDKKEGGFRQVLDLDRDFNPCLILFNESYMQWMGPNGTGGATQQAAIIGNTTAANGINTYVQNVWLYQLNGDYKVTPKLNIGASFTYAYADKKPTNTGYPTAYGGKTYLSDEYGYEADLTLKYKIFDNLEYMVGAAYLWTGDYFKGIDDKVKLSNNYLLTHKLTLTF
ncbi:MAG: hypothetical protein JW943_01675 [Deltaproteobacteria bacterium]|nr:hypothetical protein [Deltaproteobacteria bacterium]